MNDFSLPPTDGAIWPPNVMVARARVARSLAASAIVTGSSDPLAMESYRSWIMVSLLLGDVSVEDAVASLGRAEMIYDHNVSVMATLNPLEDPWPPSQTAATP